MVTLANWALVNLLADSKLVVGLFVNVYPGLDLSHKHISTPNRNTIQRCGQTYGDNPRIQFVNPDNNNK